jgi:hypothetical protein
VLLADLLGVPAGAVPATLSDLVGSPVAAADDVRLEPVSYGFGSPATGGLWRVRGRDWSLFVKLLHHVRHWPGLSQLPPHLAGGFAADFPWRSETELWDPRVQASLPPGLRSPVLHRLVELPDDRLALWQEDIAAAPESCDLDLFERAAFLLGRWNARSTTLSLNDFPPGYALRLYGEQAVAHRGLGPLRSDEIWHHPWLAGHADLRAGLLELGPRIPDLLDRLDTLPQALPHGDASPQNLLVPLDGSAEFVVIDLSFRTRHALGFDLGQLLVGLTHAGLMPAATLAKVAELIVPAYLRGLAADGVTGVDTEVHDGYATSVLVRSGFDGFRYDLLGQDDARHEFDERVALARFLLEQYHRLHA